MVDNRPESVLKASELVHKMQTGNVAAIAEGFTSPGALLRINAIINAVKFKVTPDEFISRIRDLTRDDNYVSGYQVSDFAYAALDILGIQRFKGDRPEIKQMIDCRLSF